MASVINVKVIYDGRDKIRNARVICPICKHENKKPTGTGRTRNRWNIITTTYTEECSECGSRWEVETDEEDE